MLDLVLWAGRLLFLILLYRFLFQIAVRVFREASDLAERGTAAGLLRRTARTGRTREKAVPAAARAGPAQAEPAPIRRDVRLALQQHPPQQPVLYDRRALASPAGGLGAGSPLAPWSPGDELRLRIPLAFGRVEGNEVRLGDRYASGRHARLEAQGASIVIHDLGSTNGTYLNGRRIQASAPVRVGDVIQIGETSFVVRGEAG